MKMSPSTAKICFVHYLQTLVPRPLLEESVAKLKSLKKQEDQIAFAFDHSEETSKLEEQMLECRSIEEMQQLFCKASSGVQASIVLRAVRLTERLERLPDNIEIDFPDDPFEAWRKHLNFELEEL